MKKNPVSPILFDDIARFCRRPDKGQEGTSLLLDVARQFYLQFFENVIGQKIEGIDVAAKQTSARERQKLGKSKKTPAVVPLLVWFEELCEMHPNLKALAYVPSEHVEKQFICKFMPEFVRRACAWAVTTRREGLKRSATKAAKAYDKFAKTNC